MNFKNWEDYRERNKNFEIKIYHKAGLKELNLKPKKDAIPQVHGVYTGGVWRDFNFYTLDQSEPIRKRKKHEIIDLDMTLENLCKSLYVINKSAKKSRDTKNYNYFQRNFGIVNSSKTRQQKLYDLKNSVMDKLIKNNELKLEGYHKQFDNLLLYYTYKDYGFHMIADPEHIKRIKEYTLLGDIDDKISAEVTRDIDIKFNDAVNLLKKYIEIKE